MSAGRIEDADFGKSGRLVLRQRSAGQRKRRDQGAKTDRRFGTMRA
jgi:hypothetical protein